MMIKILQRVLRERQGSSRIDQHVWQETLISYMLELVVILTLLLNSNPLSATAGNAPVLAPQSAATSIPAMTATDRESIKKIVIQSYDGKMEDDVYSDILKYDMHYLYIGFLEMFPSTSRKAEIESKLKRFRQFVTSVNKETVFTDQELKDKFNWNGKETIYQWTDGPAITTREGKHTLYVGTLCLGNLQFRGSWTFENDGTHFRGGSTIIYPTFKPSSTDKSTKQP